jgi:hypothetical protein
MSPLHVHYPMQLSEFIKLELSWQILEKSKNVKFHEYLPIGRQVAQFGRRDTQTNETALVIALRDKVKAPP